MQKKAKISLLLLTLLFLLVLSISSSFALDLDDSTNNLTVLNDDESISIESMETGYDDVSSLNVENDDSRSIDSAAVDDGKLGYAQSTSDAYIKFDQEDITINEGESVTISGALVMGRNAQNPGGGDFPLYVTYSGGNTFVDLHNHRFTLTLPASKFVASNSPYQINFEPEDCFEYVVEYVEIGNPEMVKSWVIVTVNSASFPEAYVNYAGGNDNNDGRSTSTAFKTIEHALSEIDDGGTIYVSGTYELDGVGVDGITINKNVNIVGVGDDATFDADGNGRILYIDGAYTIGLSNLSFINADVSSGSDKRGGALWVRSATLNIDNCKFIDNTAGPSSSYGGAINLKSTTTTITDSYFEGNTALYTGGAINAETGNVLLDISGCTFTNNEATNTGWVAGGTICSYGPVTVDRSIFYGNKIAEGKNGRSINMYSAGSLSVTNSVLLDGDNSVYSESSTTTLENNWWGNNESTLDSNPKDLGYTNKDVDSYLCLALSTAASNPTINTPIDIDIEFVSSTGDDVNLPDLDATVSSSQGTFDESSLTLTNGAGQVEYTSTTIGDNDIAVDVLGVTDTLTLNFANDYEVGQIVETMPQIESGVVSGNAEFAATHPWDSNGVSGSYFSGSLSYTIPDGMTDIKSAIVIVNAYSGNGANNYGMYSNVTMTTPNGFEVLGYETLRFDGFPSLTGDPTVYGINSHTTRQYSDYQMIYNVTDKISNLASGDVITIGVNDTKISDLAFDGRIKLIGLFFAYDDGDSDKYTYWLDVGQLWTQDEADFNFLTEDYSTEPNEVFLRLVACSSSLASEFNFNGNYLVDPTEYSNGPYYQDCYWDDVGDEFVIEDVNNLYFTAPAEQGSGWGAPSFKATVGLLVAYEKASLLEAYVDYANGNDNNNGESTSTAFKTIEHALSVVEENGVIYVSGTNYLDGVDANGLTIDKAVSIVGLGDDATIDANHAGRIFKIDGAYEIGLSNLAFVNADVSGASDKRGGALWVNGATLTVDNCKFINNTAGNSGSYGGAINLKSSTTTIKDSYFEDNTAWYTGGAINAENTNVLLNISGSTFKDNRVLNTVSSFANGGAICSYNTVIINKSVFYGNGFAASDKNGRSINQYGTGSLTITNSILLDGEKGVWIVTGPTTLENNWWGNNETTQDTNPKDLNFTNADVGSYMYLSLSTSASTLETGEPVTIDIELVSQDPVDLPDLTASLSSADGTFVEDTVTLVGGVGSAAFTTDKVGTNTLSVDVLGVTDSIDLTFEEVYQKGQIVEKMVEIDRGVVSGNAEYIAVNPWTASGSLTYTIPENVTDIKSAFVIINDYSGNGAQNYGLYSNVTLNTNNGLEVLAYDTLRMDEFPSFTSDPNVYGVNSHTTRQYSDYQMLFDITDKVSNLNSGDTITIGVTNSKIADLQFDGRIKLISLFFAYDDGDEDNFTYWLNAGQLWTTGSESFSIDTSDYSGKDNNITIKCVALSSQIGSFKINNVNNQPDSVVGGNYYLYMTWANMAPIFNKGQDTSFFFTCSDQGLYTPSFKTNAVLLVATELAVEPVLTEVYVNYAEGSDSYLGTTASAPFKTIEHALSVVGDNAIIHIADGVNYLDDVNVSGLNINKNVTIIGMGDNVVIDARNAGRIFKIQADSVSLSNLIFKNANATNDNDKRGAALWVNGTTLAIDNCQFINNTAGPASSYGGAITLKASNTTITNSQFDGNTAFYTGAAVNAEKGNVYLGIDNCLFKNNEVTNVASNWANGAAICAYGPTVVTNSVFYNNSAKNGKSIYKYAGDLTVSNSILLDGNNSIYKYDANSQADLNNNWWGNNDTTRDSTPKDLTYTNADVDTYLYLNLTMYSKGLEVGDVATVNINLFSNDGSNIEIMDLLVNVEAVNGALNTNAITLVNGKDGEVQYTISEVGDNTVTVDILGIKESITLTSDDVISADVLYVDYESGSNAYRGDSWDSALKNLEKAIDRVNDNGVIYVANGVTYLLDSTSASGIAINKNVKIIGESINATVSGNDAKRIFNVANGYTLTITNLTLTNGYSTAQGGAIFINNGGAINISNSVISNSRANNAGGAIGATQGYINNINNVTFINNYAGNYGGAVGISAGTATNSAITIGENNKFINNSASNVGSAIGSGNPPVTIGKNNLFEANKGLTSNGKGTVGSNKITLDTGNVFVNNYAAQGGALFGHYNSGSATGSYCFFINNTDSSGYALRQYGNKANSFTLENCYWGTNTPDFNTIYNKAFTHNAYLVLDISADKNEIPFGDSAAITIDLTKNQNGAQVDVDSLPASVPLTFTVVNGNVDPENVNLVKGSASTTYVPQANGEGSVTVNLYSVSETLNFMSSAPDVAIGTVSTPWAQGIYPAVNNTFTVKLSNNDEENYENVVLEMYSNETGEIIANYTIDSLAPGSSTVLLVDPTIRPLTEDTVWPAAQNNKVKFTFNLKYMDKVIATKEVDKAIAYAGYLNKTYAYGGHDNIINRNYTISGDIIISTQPVSTYTGATSTGRTETWNIETPEDAEIVKVLLYFNYNWDGTFFPNGWTLYFNEDELIGSELSHEIDRGNLGTYGALNYGLVVYDVTDCYNVNGENSFIISKTGTCALYPSTLFVLYNVSGSNSVKDVYFTDICDVFGGSNSQVVGYEDLLKFKVNYNDINVDDLVDATWYVFSGSSSKNNNLTFNSGVVVSPFNDYTANDCRPYSYNVADLIENNNEAWFVTCLQSTTTVAYEQVLVVERSVEKLNATITAPTSLTVDVDGTVNVNASTDSDGALSYVIANTTIATVSDDGVVTGLIGGSTTLTVSVPETETYNAASVDVVVTVNKLDATITVDDSFEVDVDGTVDVGASTDSDGTLTYVSNDTGVATVSGNTVTGVKGGKVKVTVSVPETDRYNAQSVDVVVTVNKLDATITVNDTLVVDVDGTVDVGASTDSDGDLVYEIANISIATVSDAGVVTGVIGGSTTLTVSVPETDRFNAQSVDVVVTVNKLDATITVNDTLVVDVGGTVDVGASTDSDGALSYVVADEFVATVSDAGVVTGVIGGSTTLTVSVPETDRYNAQSVDVAVTVQSPAAETTLKSEYTSIPSIYAGVVNNLTLTVANTGDADGDNVAVYVYIANGISGIFDSSDLVGNATIADFVVGETYTLNFIDETIRPVTENTVIGNNNENVTYIVIVENDYGVIGSADYSFVVLYNGNLGKDFAYPAADPTLREYTVSDVIVLTNGSYGSGASETSRNDVYNVEFDGTVAEALLYVPYTWDKVADGDFNTWNTTFNGQAIVPIASYRDQGNLGKYGNCAYGVVVYNVTSFVNAGENVFALNKTKGNVGVYPTSLIVLVNDPSSLVEKTVYIWEETDLLSKTNNKNLDASFTTTFETIDGDATLYVFAASAQAGEGNLVINDDVRTDVWSGSSSSFDIYQTAVDAGNITVKFESTGSTILALHQMVVVENAKEVNNITVMVEDTTLPGDVVVNVVADVDDTYTVTIGDYSVDVVVEAGEGSATVAIPAGENYIATTSWERESYVANITDATFNVVKGIPTFNVTANSIVYGKNLTVKVHSDDNLAYRVNVTVGDQSVLLRLKDGSRSAKFSGLEAGNYTVLVVYKGDDNYEAASANVTVEVAKATTKIKITGNEPTYGEDLVVNVELEEDINSQVVVTIGDVSEVVSLVDGNGSAVFTGLAAGSHEVSVAFDGDNNYQSKTLSAHVHVLKAAPMNFTVSADAVAYGEDLVVNVALSDNVAYRINVTVGDQSQLLRLKDGQGSVKFSGLAVGTYTVVAVYKGDENYTSASAETTAEVVKAEPKNLKVTAKVVTGGDLVVDVSMDDDVAYRINVTVGDQSKLLRLKDGKGTLTFSGLEAGTYTVVALYKGDANYAAVSAETTVEIKPLPKNLTVTADAITYGDDLIVNVSLDDEVDYRINVTVGDQSQLLRLKDGKGTLKFSGLAAGNYTIVALYKGDSSHSPIAAEAAVEVAKATPNLTVSAKTSGSYVVVDVNLPDEVDYRVNVTVGNESKLLRIKDGQGTAKFKDLEAGTYTVTATYKGDDNYLPVSVDTTVEVK